MPRSPKTRCVAQQQTRAVLEPASFRLCHPVHHPGLAAGPKVPGAGVRSSFIFSSSLRGGWSKSLLQRQCQKALGCSSLLMGTQRARTSSGSTSGEGGTGMELEMNPDSPQLPALPASISVCLSPEPAHHPHHWDLLHQWRGQATWRSSLGGKTHSRRGCRGTAPSSGLQRGML